jgi:quercetin dioxygenase-like cupin family protein
MHVARGKDANPQRSTREIFTGEVHQHSFIGEGEGKELRIGLVRFSPGGRTKWHTHPFEQGLIIVEGKGIVATEEQENVVETGDVVVIPPQEKHWHGGTDTTGMAHIAINKDGAATVLEAVDEIKTKDV